MPNLYEFFRPWPTYFRICSGRAARRPCRHQAQPTAAARSTGGHNSSSSGHVNKCPTPGVAGSCTKTFGWVGWRSARWREAVGLAQEGGSFQQREKFLINRRWSCASLPLGCGKTCKSAITAGQEGMPRPAREEGMPRPAREEGMPRPARESAG